MLKLTQIRGKAIFVTLVGVCISIGVVLWLAWYEPSYAGVRLSYWLMEFQNENVERRLAASAAIKQIGPTAVPYLVKYLETDPAKEESKFLRWRLRVFEWLAAHTSLKIPFVRYPSVRLQALAALDALGPDGKDALPALERLVGKYPEQPDLVFAVARLGEVGESLLQRSLTNSAPHDSDTLRIAAQTCLQLTASRSYLLYPELAPDAPTSEYLARCAQYHLAMTQTALADYRSQRIQLTNSFNTPARP